MKWLKIVNLAFSITSCKRSGSRSCCSWKINRITPSNLLMTFSRLKPTLAQGQSFFTPMYAKAILSMCFNRSKSSAPSSLKASNWVRKGVRNSFLPAVDRGSQGLCKGRANPPGIEKEDARQWQEGAFRQIAHLKRLSVTQPDNGEILNGNRQDSKQGALTLVPRITPQKCMPQSDTFLPLFSLVPVWHPLQGDSGPFIVDCFQDSVGILSHYANELL